MLGQHSLHISQHLGLRNTYIYSKICHSKIQVTPPVPGVVAATETAPRTCHVYNISATFLSDIIRMDNAKTGRL